MNAKNAPKVLMEFYGASSIAGSLDFAMQIDDVKSEKKQLQIGNSIKMHVGKEGQMMPEESATFVEQPNISPPKSEQPSVEGDQVVDTSDKPAQ